MDRDEGLLEVDLRVTEDDTVLIVRGEIDLLTVSEFDAALDQLPGDRSAALDVSSVTFMSSGGLGVLMSHRQRFSRSGGALRISKASESVHHLLDVAGLDCLLPQQAARSL